MSVLTYSVVAFFAFLYADVIFDGVKSFASSASDSVLSRASEFDGTSHWALTGCLFLLLVYKEISDRTRANINHSSSQSTVRPETPMRARSMAVPPTPAASAPRSAVPFLPTPTFFSMGAPPTPAISTVAPPEPPTPVETPIPETKPVEDEGSPDIAMAKVESAFKGAMKNADIVTFCSHALRKYGYGSSTLLATSLCCDEVNRDLEKSLIDAFGDNFSMGGLAGFAFGGVTSFGAMAHHIPAGGSCLVVYGPHVGIDSHGKVGKINRRGRPNSGACCGSAAAAAAYVEGVRRGKAKAKTPSRPLDAQQYFVGSMLLPHAERLARAKDAMVELPHALYEVQDELMLKILMGGSQEVGGEGKIALLGGIQINTPSGAPDYFLPKKFEIRNNKGQLLENFLWG